MDYTFYAPSSDGDYERIVNEIVGDIEEDADQQRSLTTITLDCDDPDRPEDAKILVYSREWFPESRHPKHDIQVVPIDDVADMSIRLPSKRMLRLPPRKIIAGQWGERGNTAPPYTGLHYNDDTILASPDVVKILEAVQKDTGMDIESMVKDLEATFNHSEESLDFSLQRGLVELSGERSVAMRQRQDLEHRLHRVYIEVMNQVPEQGYEHNMGALIQDLINELENGAIFPRLLREQKLTVEGLVKDWNDLQEARAEARSVSHEVFVDTIESEGIGMPSFFEDAETAVTQVGFDSEDFLKL